MTRPALDHYGHRRSYLPPHPCECHDDLAKLLRMLSERNRHPVTTFRSLPEDAAQAPHDTTHRKSRGKLVLTNRSDCCAKRKGRRATIREDVPLSASSRLFIHVNEYFGVDTNGAQKATPERTGNTGGEYVLPG